MKKILSFILILGTFCFFTPFAYATTGVTFDTSGKVVQSGGTATLSYTVGTGTGAVMIIGISCSGSPVLCAFSAPTYNGTTATLIESRNDNNNAFETMWYINNPTQGSAHNVAITNTGGGSFEMYVASYLGSNGLTGAGNATGGSGDGVSSVTNTLTTQKNNSWLVSVVSTTNSAPSGGTGTTARQTNAGGGGGAAGGIGDSNGGLSIGSNSMQWTFSSGNYASSMVEIPPIPGGKFAFFQFMDF